MRIELITACDVGKGFTSKLEKQPDDTMAVIGHLKIADTIISREHIDALCNQPEGWSSAFLFDEFGAPRLHLQLVLPKLSLSFSGGIYGKGEDDKLVLVDATLSDIVLALSDKGAKLSGGISWKVGGDEAGDTETLLGQLCLLRGALFDAGQGDLLKAAA